jgi:SAM-dependent methyltransferase
VILYAQSSYPIFQNCVYETTEDAINCPKGEIKIIEDGKTGLIYNAAFNPDLLIYDKHYNNEQGLSPSFKQHLQKVAELIEGSLGKEALVEVGCGKGFFLEMLLERNIDVKGFDSTYDGDNPRIVKKYFNPDIIATPAKGLILRHVLEHIPNPYNFLCQLRDANGGGGLIYIEVPCFDWILHKRAWFDIFYEHVNYFRLNDFDRMFNRVIKKGRFFGGQYLYVVADLLSLREPLFSQSDAVDFPSDFLYRSNFEEKNRMPVCVWGGASKGVIFSMLRMRAGLIVDAVVDVNPAKQGKFLPATGLKVLSPERALADLPGDAVIYVMNSNYLQEIKEMSHNKFEYIGIDQ